VEVDILYRNKGIEKACTEQKEAVKRYGPNNQKKLFQRLSEIDAADNLEILCKIPAARCHPLTGKLKGLWAVDLVHPFRLLFRLVKSDGTDIEKRRSFRMVVAVMIWDIKDYH
jgi:proteic killer suppression protein